MKNILIYLFCSVLCLQISCKKGNEGENGGNTNSQPVASVTISVTGDVTKVGNTAKATATAKDASGNTIAGRVVTWGVDNPTILSINQEGNISILKSGTTEISAKIDNISSKYTVNVGTTQTELSSALGCNCDASDFSTTPITFTVPIMKPEDIGTIIPLGNMVKGHVTPTSHQYYYPNDAHLGAAATEKSVYAPADGYITRVTRTSEASLEPGVPARDNYALLIQHNCTFYTDLSLITSLPNDILAAIGTVERGQSKNVKVKITAGQIIARVGGQSLDVVVLDQYTAPKQYIVPSHYTEVGKKYKTDPFPFYTQAIRDQLYTKTIRVADPRGGRFDYDIDGKAVGTWFLQGTNGYSGKENFGPYYWNGHLSLVYDPLDPTQIIISIGKWPKIGATESEIKSGWQFTVTGNTPDPKNVDVSSGMVKYEVNYYSYVLQNNPTQMWNFQSNQGPVTPKSNYAEGILLVQMMDNRLLKVETFPGKTAAQVTGFTSAAQLYER